MADTLKALRERVLSYIGNRNYGPREQAEIIKLADSANGDCPPEVHEVARGLRFYGPSRPERGPSPMDEAISAQEAVEAAARAAEAEARRNLNPRERWDSTGAYVGFISLDPVAHQEFIVATEQRRLETAKLQDLKARRARWYALSEARFHDPDGGPGLTLEELHARLEREGD